MFVSLKAVCKIWEFQKDLYSDDGSVWVSMQVVHKFPTCKHTLTFKTGKYKF